MRVKFLSVPLQILHPSRSWRRRRS